MIAEVAPTEDGRSRRAWPNDAVAARGWWCGAAGRERRFIGSVTLCPRFRPHLFAVVHEQDAGTATYVHVRRVRGLHVRGSLRDLSVPAAPCGCPEPTGHVSSAAVSICLEDGEQLQLQGVDAFDFAIHLEAAWPRASLRLAGTLF